ncbi:MAG: hypothetical protein AAFP23_10145 [Pseudomonadota bacterium]
MIEALSTRRREGWRRARRAAIAQAALTLMLCTAAYGGPVGLTSGAVLGGAAGPGLGPPVLEDVPDADRQSIGQLAGGQSLRQGRTRREDVRDRNQRRFDERRSATRERRQALEADQRDRGELQRQERSDTLRAERRARQEEAREGQRLRRERLEEERRRETRP